VARVGHGGHLSCLTISARCALMGLSSLCLLHDHALDAAAWHSPHRSHVVEHTLRLDLSARFTANRAQQACHSSRGRVCVVLSLSHTIEWPDSRSLEGRLDLTWGATSGSGSDVRTSGRVRRFGWNFHLRGLHCTALTDSRLSSTAGCSPRSRRGSFLPHSAR
jgi:hypothetical protein